MKRLFVSFATAILLILPIVVFAQTTKIKKVTFQGFWWDYKNDNYAYSWSNYLTELAPRLKSMGFDAIWIPPSYKNQFPSWVGYGPMDHYDLGDKYQKGSPSVRTALGTKDELLRMIAVMHANGIEVIQDVVLNHVDGAGSASGGGGQDTEPTYSMVTNSGYKNFRYACYATPAIDESQDDYWTRRGRWPKNYTNFHPNANNNCTTGDICSPYFGPDIDYSLNSSGPSSNIPTSGTPAGYPATRPYHNPAQGTDYMYNGATEWLKWYHKQTNVDGYRWDAVKHFPVYVQRDITRHAKYIAGAFNGGYSMFNIGEWIGNKSELDQYVINMAQPSLTYGYEEHTGTFDFSLRAYSGTSGASIYDMVVNNFSGGYDLANFPGIQQDKRYTDYATPSARVHRTIPFVNSHDTYRPILDPMTGNFSQPLGVSSGWNTGQELGGNGQHIDPREPRMAAAYAVICAMDGNPMVFFEDVFNIGTNSKRWTHEPTNTIDLPTWNDISNIVQCHQKLQFKEGNYKVRSAESGAFFPSGSSSNNHLVFERSAKAVIGVNDMYSTDQEIWIDSDFAAGTILMDYSGANGTTTSVVQSDKRVFIKTKAVGHTVPNVFGHGYSVWAPVPGNVAFASVVAMLAYLDYTPTRSTETMQEWEMDEDLGDSHCGSLGYGGRTPDNSPNDRVVGKIFAAANTNVAYTVTLGTVGNGLTLDICKLDGTVLSTVAGSTATISGSFTNTATRWLTIKVRNTLANTPGQKCFVKMTYTAPAAVITEDFPAATTVSIWTSNGGSSNWNDPRNWEECKVPICTGSVLIPHEVKFMPQVDPCFTGTFVNNAGLSLKPKVFLHGPYETGTGTMRDDLRMGNHIPLTTPYGGTETTTSGVLAVMGNNAIVDWVKIELRDKNTPSTVLVARSALLQRDGDIVATDGVSPIFLNGWAADNYYIAVRHRNHLGAMTAAAIALGNTINTTDFSSASTYGANAQRELSTGVFGLWSGNGNGDNKVKYQGGSSDANATLSQVLSFAGNSGTFAYNYDLAFGYFSGDYNMDGKVKYQGGGNDLNVLLSNVLSYPGNNNVFAYNYDLLLEQLP